MVERVLGIGPKPAHIAIFGERPGPREMLKGYPFAGQTGKELDRRLWDCHLQRQLLWLDNLVPTRQGNRDVPPTPEEIHANEPYLWGVLDEVRPEIIVTMGASATRYFLGQDANLERCHAIPRPLRFTYSCGLRSINTIIFPMYHIAAGFHVPALQPFIEYDWQQFALFLKYGDHFLPEPVDSWAGNEKYSQASADEFYLLREILNERPKLIPAIDTEGLSGDPWGLSISIAPGTSLVIKRCQEQDWMFPMLNAALGGRRVTLHNSLHDLQILRELGIEVDDFEDTMVMAYLLQIEPQGLKPLSYRHSGMVMRDYLSVIAPYAQKIYWDYIGRAAHDGVVLRAEMGQPKSRKMQLGKRLMKMLKDAGKETKPGKEPLNLKDRWDNLDDSQKDLIQGAIGPFPEVGLKDVPDLVAIPYSARDADATFRLKPALTPRITALGLDAILDLDLAVIPMVDRMQQVGMLVDKLYLHDLGTVLGQEMELLKAGLREQTGRPDYNPASGDQLAEILFDHFRLDPVKMTKSKKRPAVDAKVMEELLIKYQDLEGVVRFINDSQDFTEHQKLKGTYVDNLERVVKGDNRIHASLRITRVVSGRLSSHDPNLLAIPVRTQLGRLIRGGFVAPKGRLLGSWDLDQIEMRVLAHESGDEKMIAVLSDPSRHIHKQTTFDIYGIPVDQVDKNSTEYMMSKNISFGIVYGITAQGLRAQMAQRGQHRTEDECQAMIDRYLDVAYPGVKVFMERCRCDAARQGFVRTMLGRLRYIPGIKSAIPSVRSEAERAAGNHPIQGGASDIVKCWMKAVRKNIVQVGLAQPLLQVHDELIMEFDKGNEEVIDYMMKESLAEAVAPLNLKVPVKCGGKWAESWGKLK